METHGFGKMVYDFCSTWLYHSGNQPGSNGSRHCNKLSWELDSIRSRYCISDSISHDTASHKKRARHFAVVTIIYCPLVNSTCQEKLTAFDRILRT